MSDNTLHVNTATARYSVIVQAGALALLPQQLRDLGLQGTVWLVSDSAVWESYGEPLAARLGGAGYSFHTYRVPSGEASKSQAQLWQLYTWMIANGVERRDTVLALGGGVIGDLAGFAAASVLRSIAFVQLPTTLLAMVDAAIGGKTGINHPLGKNLIGAFHQPRMVLADTTTLRSLPTRELCAGWAEVVKHGVIRDRGLFELLEAHAAELQHPDQTPELISAVVRRAAAVKVAVVSADEREQGERITLNYGHTLGHALEAALGYTALLHGEAVAIGMHAAARIAAHLGILSTEDVVRQQRLLLALGLPTAFPKDIDPDQIMHLTLRDKKVQRKRVRWVLPTTIGAVSIRDDVPDSVVRAVLKETE